MSMYRLCVGVMGIDPNAFRWMTLAEIREAHKGWFENREQRYRDEWERERWATANLINMQMEVKDRTTPDKMFPFPWDAKPKKKRKVSKAKRKEERKRICEEAMRLRDA